MELWIQPCAPCAELYGQPSTVEPHENLTLNAAGAVKDAQAEQHFTCIRCGAAFARIVAGSVPQQVWLLLNAGQH